MIGGGHYCTTELQLTITFIIDPFISIIMSLIYHGLCYLGHLFRLKGRLLMFGFKLDENSCSAPGTSLLWKVLCATSSVFICFNSFYTGMDSLIWFNCLVDAFFFLLRCNTKMFFQPHISKPLNFEATGTSCIIFEI